MNPRDNFDPNRDLDDRDDTTSETAVQTAGTTQVVPVPTSATERGGTADTTTTAETRAPQTADSDSEATEHEPGMPGDGAGRRDEIGGKSGVYPFNDAPADLENAPVRTGAEWGQGERGPEGYYDAGTSEGSPAATAQELLEDDNAG